MWYKNTSGQNTLTFIFFTIGCLVIFFLAGTKPRLSDAEKVEIQKVILNQVFDFAEASPQNDNDCYFIGFEDKDAPADLISSFSEHQPEVAPLSASDISFGFSSIVHHKKHPDKKGTIVNIKYMEKMPDGDVRAKASLYQSRGSTAVFEYVLQVVDDGYRITSFSYEDKSETEDERSE